MRVRLVLGLAALGVGSVIPLAAGPNQAAVSALPARPNVVLVVTDDQTFESFPAAMPFLAGEPGGHWLRFTNAVVGNANCCPSRATILSGRYSHHTDVETNNDGWKFDDAHSLAVWLRSAGYRTSLIGKYLNDYPWAKGPGYVPPGWDNWVAYSPNAVTDGSADLALVENGTLVRYDTTVQRNYSTDIFRRKAVSFLKAAPEPFFLYLASLQPHYPAAPAVRHAGSFTDLPQWRPPNFDEADVSDKPAWVRKLPPLGAAEVAEIDLQHRNAYRALLAVDEAVKAVVDQLRRRAILDNTVIIFLSDNNVALGEHGYALHKACAYEECVHVPMVVRYPTGWSSTVSNVVSNVDIATTIADLANVTPTIPQDGRSMRPLLEGAATSWPDEALLHKGPSTTPNAPDFGPPEHEGPGGASVGSYWGVRTRRWKYVEYRSGELELYDLAADPWELTNRAADPAYATARRSMADRLARLRSR